MRAYFIGRLLYKSTSHSSNIKPMKWFVSQIFFWSWFDTGISFRNPNLISMHTFEIIKLQTYKGSNFDMDGWEVHSYAMILSERAVWWRWWKMMLLPTLIGYFQSALRLLYIQVILTFSILGGAIYLSISRDKWMEGEMSCYRCKLIPSQIVINVKILSRPIMGLKLLCSMCTGRKLVHNNQQLWIVKVSIAIHSEIMHKYIILVVKLRSLVVDSPKTTWNKYFGS